MYVECIYFKIYNFQKKIGIIIFIKIKKLKNNYLNYIF